MRTLLLAGFFFTTPVIAPAQQASPAPGAPPVVILFVGNSYTQGVGSNVIDYHRDQVTTEPADGPPGKIIRYGGVPAVFKQFADEAGLAYEVHMVVSGGKSLEWHYHNTLPVIAQAKWNAVVLQGYSTEPLPAPRGGNPDSFIKHAVLLTQAIHGANSAAKVYLYETFPRSDQVYPEKAPYHNASVEAMAADLLDGCLQAFTQDGQIKAIALAGTAWLPVFAAGLAQHNPYLPPEPGKFNLWARDNHHASAYGTYLNSLVIFETITGQDATKLGATEQAAHDLGIEPEAAVQLQAIADETVRITGPHVRR